MLWFAVEGRAEGRVFWVGFKGRNGLSLAGNRSGNSLLSSPDQLLSTLLSFPPEMPSDFLSSLVLSPDHSSFSFAGLRPMNAAERRWQVQGRRSGACLAGAGGDRSGQNGRSAGGVYCRTASAGEGGEDEGAVAAGRAGSLKKKKEKVNGLISPVRKKRKKKGRKKERWKEKIGKNEIKINKNMG